MSICGFSRLIFHKEVNSGEASKTSRHLRLYFCILGKGREERKEYRAVFTYMALLI